jgi:TP901 family phage tail tape measure protein
MFKNHIVEIGVYVKDKATDSLKRISQESKKMTGSFKNIGTSLGAFNRNIDTITTRMDKMANSFYRFNMYSSSMLRNMRNIGVITAGIGAAVGVDSAKKAIDFEYETYKMQTRMGLKGKKGDETRKDIAKYMLDLNKEVSLNATEVAGMGTILGAAGINNAPDMKSMLKTTSYFSEAVDSDPAEAARMIVTATKGWDLSMKDSMNTADKLTVALNESMLDVAELPHAIGELAGRAKALGQGMESSLVALMVAKDQGLDSSQAAQDFTHGLGRIAQAARTDLMTKKQKEYFEKGGIDTSFFDQERKTLKSYPEIVASFEKSMRNLGFMPNKEEFYKQVQENGGHIPDGLINMMEAQPLIQKIFGKAGMMPIIQGLQARYQDTDAEGNPIGQAYYGSDALLKMHEKLLKSGGAVSEQHKKIMETTKKSLEQLGGSWENAQIKIGDNFLPLIKAVSNELQQVADGPATDFWTLESNFGKNNSFDLINKSIDETAERLKKTNPTLAEFVKNTGHIAVNATRVSTSLGPTITQVGNAANKDLLQADWGDNIFTMPFKAIKNGAKFAWDVTRGNEQSDNEINQLPKELQNPAKLTRMLIQGGVVLMITGAVVKVIELGIRGVSLALKGTKVATSLTKSIIDLVTGGFSKDSFGKAAQTLKQNMAINANIVNVNGKVVNGGGSIPGGGSNGPITGGPPSSKNRPARQIPIPGENVPENIPKVPPKGGIFGNILGMVSELVGASFASDIGEDLGNKTSDYFFGSHYDPNKSFENQESGKSQFLEDFKELGKIDLMASEFGMFNDNFETSNNNLTTELQNGFSQNNSVLSSGFNSTRSAIENMKFNISVNPSISIQGDLKDYFTVKSQVQNDNGEYPQASFSKFMALENRRYGK